MASRWAVRDYDAWPKRFVFPIIAILIDVISLAVGVIGLWIATSVAVHLNISILAAMAVGFVVFPGVPLLLEVWHRIDRRRYGETDADHPPPRKRILRNALRFNAGLVVVMLVIFPRTVFTAMSTRGDWMLEDVRGPVRDQLLALIDKADFMYDADDNPFAAHDDSAKVEPTRIGWDGTKDRSTDRPDPIDLPPVDPVDEPGATPTPPPPSSPPPPPSKSAPRDAGVRTTTPPPPPPARPPPPTRAPPPGRTPEGVVTVDPDHDVPLIVMGPSKESSPPPPAAQPPKADDEAATPAPSPRARERYVRWLRSPRPHPIATNIPSRNAGTYQEVAAYIASREPDPFDRVKAIHDFIVVRIAYDADFDVNRLPPSDPTTVFRRREAVCAGYARLFKAMMESIGSRAVYISGDARFAQPRNPSASHAWNAVEIEGAWYLLDTTFNAGHVDGRTFVKKYKTDYLLSPPDMFVLTHFPRDPKWQLLDAPLSRGAFLRQPLILPRFYAYGLNLVKPTRSQISASGQTDFEVRNPLDASLFFAYSSGGSAGGPFADCLQQTAGPGRVGARCQFKKNGPFYVYLFAAAKGAVKHEAVLRFEVNNQSSL